MKTTDKVKVFNVKTGRVEYVQYNEYCAFKDTTYMLYCM